MFVAREYGATLRTPCILPQTLWMEEFRQTRYSSPHLLLTKTKLIHHVSVWRIIERSQAHDRHFLREKQLNYRRMFKNSFLHMWRVCCSSRLCTHLWDGFVALVVFVLSKRSFELDRLRPQSHYLKHGGLNLSRFGTTFGSEVPPPFCFSLYAAASKMIALVRV